MKKRLCIFSFFDKTGYVDDYVIYLLKELISCTNRLIIIVNGMLDERGQAFLTQFTDEVYIRENIGYDAGAYKYVYATNCLRKKLTLMTRFFCVTILFMVHLFR